MQDLFTPYKEKRRNSFVSTQNSTLLRMKYCVKNRTQSNQIKKDTQKRISCRLFLAFVAYMEKILTYERKKKTHKIEEDFVLFSKIFAILDLTSYYTYRYHLFRDLGLWLLLMLVSNLTNLQLVFSIRLILYSSDSFPSSIHD